MQIFVVLRKISKEKNVMKQDIQRIMLAAAKPLFLIFILYILKIMEVGIQSPNQKIPDRKTKCVIKTHINIKQNVIFGAKLKPV